MQVKVSVKLTSVFVSPLTLSVALMEKLYIPVSFGLLMLIDIVPY